MLCLGNIFKRFCNFPSSLRFFERIYDTDSDSC